ncbi:MAG: PstS family phosphate ABC transporter substrate-binding protein [Fimbriimonadales bacterium]|nr:PstS family phosphate ABC transporter substrate-binding protein [Fimbriimonadales bacterium]
MKIRTGFLVLAALMAIGCGGPKEEAGGGAASGGSEAGSLQGAVSIDGSSTVFPITQALAEEFMNENRGVNVTVAESGTGGGFKKFGRGEIDITGASRPIEPSEEELCKKNGVEYLEIPIAFDGLTVVVNPKNTWAESLTVAELKKIWEPASKVNNWSQVRAGFPNKPLKLYGPGTDSGTFDYFCEAINGGKGKSRSDYTASEDDNVLVQGVAGDEGALGYFGIAYFMENKDKIRAVKIDGGEGPVEPSPETIRSGKYQPLSRPLFLYVNAKSLDKPQVKAFLEYCMDHAETLVGQVGYVALPAEAYGIGKKIVAERRTGSRFLGETAKGMKIEDVLAREK